MGNLMVLFNFIFTTLSGCHGNEIWDKMGYNSAYIRDRPICEIFASIGGFSGMGHWMLPIYRIFPDRLPLPWKRNSTNHSL